MRTIALPLIALLLIGLPACRRMPPEQTDPLPPQHGVAQAFPGGEGRTIYRFPSPNDIMGYINTEGLSLRLDLLNPVAHAPQYLDSRVQLLNLGVYTANFAYIALFQTLAGAHEYFQAIERLAYATGLSAVFTEAVQRRVKANQSNIDSLSRIARESYNSMVSHLAASGGQRQMAIISTGGYLEALYLAMHQVNPLAPQPALIRKIYDQRFGLENLVLFMDEHRHDPFIGRLHADMLGISQGFNRVAGEAQGPSEAVRDGAGRLRFAGSPQAGTPDIGPFLSLRALVDSLRSAYTCPLKSQALLGP